MARPGDQGSARVRARRGVEPAVPPAVPWARRLYTLLLALLALLAIAGAAPSAAHAAVPGDTLGVYRGSGSPAQVASFEATLGRRVSRAHDFLDRSTWDSIMDVRWMAERWTAAGWANAMVVSVPMLPNTVPSGYGPLAAGAAGEFNAYFHTLAARLVQYGLGSAVLRLGHEFNGSWFKWTMNVPHGAADYAAFWRQIVNTMRSVPGANFTFDWAPNIDSAWIDGKQVQAADAWPGDAYVDYVGLDVYDQSWIQNYGDAAARWSQYVNLPNGLAWHAAFAASKGKPMSFPEWGLADRVDGHGGGDSPYFIQQMHEWIRSHNVAYHLYFEFKDAEAQYGVFSGAFPNAARTFTALFGSGAPPPAPLPPLPPLLPEESPGSGGPAGGATAGGDPTTTGKAYDGNGEGPSSASFAFAQFARLCIDRARITPSTRRLNLRASIAPRASGNARVELRAGGRRTTFSKKIAGGRVLVSRRLSRSQAREGTGMITIGYGGNAHTKPQQVRLRLAPRKANLRLRVAPTLAAGRLRTHGTISRRARGAVRLQLTYEIGGRTVTREYMAKISRGRWRLDAALSPLIVSEISRRTSAVHVYALYTGSLPRRIGGQMKAYELLGPG